MTQYYNAIFFPDQIPHSIIPMHWVRIQNCIHIFERGFKFQFVTRQNIWHFFVKLKTVKSDRHRKIL